MNVNRSWGWMIWTVCLLPLTLGSSLKLATAVPHRCGVYRSQFTGLHTNRGQCQGLAPE